MNKTGTIHKSQIPYDRSRLSKPAYMKIHVLKLLNFENLGLYGILLDTRGKICVKVDDTQSPNLAIAFPALRHCSRKDDEVKHDRRRMSRDIVLTEPWAAMAMLETSTFSNITKLSPTTIPPRTPPPNPRTPSNPSTWPSTSLYCDGSSPPVSHTPWRRPRCTMSRADPAPLSSTDFPVSRSRL